MTLRSDFTDSSPMAVDHAQHHNDLANQVGLPVALPGATAPARFVGGTTTGVPPTTGTFAVGDFVVDAAGNVFTCTTAGTPGTWQTHGILTGATVAPAVGTGAGAVGTATTAARADHAHTLSAPVVAALARGSRAARLTARALQR